RPEEGGGEPPAQFGFEREGDEWNPNGNHSASAVTSQAAHSGKRSLKIVASGSGSSLGNSVSTDIAGIRPGTIYALECWVLISTPGVPLELRFSRGRSAGALPGGTALPRTGGPGDAAGGAAQALSFRVSSGAGSTPGRRNSIYATTLPPFIHPVSHGPSKPGPGDAVVVRAQVAHAAEIVEALLHYDDGSGERTVPLVEAGQDARGESPSGSSVYTAKLGAFKKNTLVVYHLTARDKAGGQASYPFEGDSTDMLGLYVEDPAIRSKVPIYHLFLPPQALSDLESNPHSDAYRKGTFVHDGVVYSGVGIRYRGQTSRFIPKKHWKVKFGKDHRFTTPGGRRARSINLNSFYGDRSYLRETLSYGLWRDLGEPYLETSHVRMYVNGAYQGLYLELEPPNEDFMARNHLEGGFLWKSYSDGRGGGQRSGGFELEAGEREAGEPALAEFLEKMGSLSGKSLESYIREHMNVDGFVNFLAASQLIHSADHVQKNYLVFADKGLKFTFLPWDMDLTHG
ncbi:MAG: hypothetical protein AUI33_12390, partial [Ignavibacteria bacterium 13_1_40CM_2_61_4]